MPPPLPINFNNRAAPRQPPKPEGFGRGPAAWPAHQRMDGDSFEGWHPSDRDTSSSMFNPIPACPSAGAADPPGHSPSVDLERKSQTLKQMGVQTTMSDLQLVDGQAEHGLMVDVDFVGTKGPPQALLRSSLFVDNDALDFSLESSIVEIVGHFYRGGNSEQLCIRYKEPSDYTHNLRTDGDFAQSARTGERFESIVEQQAILSKLREDYKSALNRCRANWYQPTLEQYFTKRSALERANAGTVSMLDEHIAHIDAQMKRAEEDLKKRR